MNFIQRWIEPVKPTNRILTSIQRHFHSKKDSTIKLINRIQHEFHSKMD